METISIIIAGVGGQGSLLAGRLLGTLFMNEGYDVKVSEVHGMSQRGGSVITCVRFGQKVFSPIIETGEADYIVSFEKLEAARYTDKLKPSGIMITNTQQIDPMPVITGAAQYPKDILDDVQKAGIRVDAIDGLSLAVRAGSVKSVNVVMLGRLARYMSVPKEKWIQALEQVLAPKLIELNKKAFNLGFDFHGSDRY